MQRNTQKCTIAEAHRVSSDPHWKISLDELDKFVGLIINGELSVVNIAQPQFVG